MIKKTKRIPWNNYSQKYKSLAYSLSRLKEKYDDMKYHVAVLKEKDTSEYNRRQLIINRNLI